MQEEEAQNVSSQKEKKDYGWNQKEKRQKEREKVNKLGERGVFHNLAVQ